MGWRLVDSRRQPTAHRPEPPSWRGSAHLVGALRGLGSLRSFKNPINCLSMASGSRPTGSADVSFLGKEISSVEPQEILGLLRESFTNADKDNSGELDQSELAEVRRMSQNPTVASNAEHGQCQQRWGLREHRWDTFRRIPLLFLITSCKIGLGSETILQKRGTEQESQ